MKTLIGSVLLSLSLGVLIAGWAGLPAHAEGKSTLDNLMAAFNGESNAHARYLEFAKKAEAEGYKGAAALFTAAARSEEIHFKLHAAVIKKLGGTPQATMEKVEVKSTKENLEAALKGESYERDTMYPEFIGKAKADKNKDALRAFQFARTAEAEHAKLYEAALKAMEEWKAAKTLFVCPECGYTVLELPAEKCPSCFTPKGQFIKI